MICPPGAAVEICQLPRQIHKAGELEAGAGEKGRDGKAVPTTGGGKLPSSRGVSD